MAPVATEICDLCIVGGGYAGINALNAATKHLPAGARVIVVARERAWGGQWVDQYDYVRRHQPYKTFTVGERQWDLEITPSHSSSKKEILRHFENIAAACTSEKDIDLVKLFQYEYAQHAVAQEAKFVEISAIPFISDLHLPSIKIVASRLIMAIGLDLPPKSPLVVAAAPLINSLCPVNVSMPKWDLKMRYSEAPIIVIGSGNAAVDTMKYIIENIPTAVNRLMCVSGRGTFFIVNELLFPMESGKCPNDPNISRGMEVMATIVAEFDGTNGLEVLKALEAQGLLHSAVPDPGSFALGTCSNTEIKVVKNALSPTQEKVIKAHLMDVVSEDGVPLLKLRSLDGASVFHRKIPVGSFIINCTDNIPAQDRHEAVLSVDGLVLRPQQLAGFSGPSANLGTHLFYLGRLEPVLRHMPCTRFDLGDKINPSIRPLALVIMNAEILRQALPDYVRQNCATQASFERIQKLMPKMFQAHGSITARYTGSKSEQQPPPVLGGNLICSRL